MCGICGKVGFDQGYAVDPALLHAMMDTMHHRGPDGQGTYFSDQVGLGHKRLSIIDLDTGKQPISNENGTVWIVFNGEIYNYQELRSQLQSRGHTFRTKTDTEVIVHSYEEYGTECVSKLRGMFAFAIWDESKATLFLARDRVGIKPLYYSLIKGSLLFASEFKALLRDPSVPRDLNLPIVDRFLTYMYVPGPDTLFKSILKLPPGHTLLLRDGEVRLTEYWDIRFAEERAGTTLEELKEELTEKLRESVRLHMISDVPVGFLLSGGVDSTALLSYAVDETAKEISTFTIGFEGEQFADERPYARLAARQFDTSHYEMTISAREFADFLPKYVWHMEEPVCEPPAVALYYVSKLAKDYVKVLISGEGGDEAFAGYQNYRNLLWLERIKRVLRGSNGAASTIISWLGSLPALERVRKYGPLFRVPLQQYYYSRTSSPFSFFNNMGSRLYSNGTLSSTTKEASLRPTTALFQSARNLETLNKMLYIDTKTWLPDDLLVKADKITMANSIELRVPLLDHIVLEYAASLPSKRKISGFTTKYLLKKTFESRIPRKIIKRKKTGFPVPYARWMRGELRDLVRDMLLGPRSLVRQFFDKRELEEIVISRESEPSWGPEVFALLVLEIWHRTFAISDGGPRSA